MIDKKQLIEDLLECVNNATDTQTAMTGMTMCAILMNEVIDQALPVVSHRRELLKAYTKWLNDKVRDEDELNELIDDYLNSL